jgi:hypothetical protein
MNELTMDLLQKNVVDCGMLYVSRTSTGTKKPGERYVIYLPMNRNYLWRALHNSKFKVKVLIELPENLTKLKSTTAGS